MIDGSNRHGLEKGFHFRCSVVVVVVTAFGHGLEYSLVVVHRSRPRPMQGSGKVELYMTQELAEIGMTQNPIVETIAMQQRGGKGIGGAVVDVIAGERRQ